MLPEERIRRISEILEENGFITIEELARTFDISEMTVRRDLKKCETLGIAKRCYGGAVSKNEIRTEVNIKDRQFQNIGIKERIAAHCATLVEPGDVIYLDAGTTTFCIAKAISGIPDLTVVTNDIFIAQELLNSEIQVYLLGGLLQHSSGSLLGEGTTRALENLRVKTAFVGSAAISGDLKTMTPSIEKTFLRRAICRIAHSAFLVVDASKFHTDSMYLINGLEDYTGVITDENFTEWEKQQIQERNITIIEVK